MMERSCDFSWFCIFMGFCQQNTTCTSQVSLKNGKSEPITLKEHVFSFYNTVLRARFTVYWVFKQNTFRFNRDSGERCWKKQRMGEKNYFIKIWAQQLLHSVPQPSSLLSNKSSECVYYFTPTTSLEVGRGVFLVKCLLPWSPLAESPHWSRRLQNDFCLSRRQGGEAPG